MPERRVKWLGAVGISLTPLILAACARNAQPDSQEPIYNDTPISQPTAEQASAQNPEPVNQNSTIIIEGNGKKFEILPDITIEKLLQSATELKKNAPDVKDVEFFIRNASLKFTQNPNDPNISQDILFASDVLFTQSQACNQPQLEVGEKARELTQQMASYLYVNYPSIWSVRGAPFLDGPCDWSKEDSDALVEAESTDPEPENTRSSIVIRSGNHEYKLYTDVTLDEVIGTANSLPQTSTKPQIIEKLQILRGVLEKNPDNDVYLFLLEQVLSMNNDNCEGKNSIELTKQVASWVKQKYPQRYDTSSALFERGPCSVIKEARTIVPREDQADNPTIGLEGHLVFHEKDYSYYTLFPEMTLDLLLDSQPSGSGILQFLKDNGNIAPQAADEIRSILTAAKQKELANSQDPAIIRDVNSAASVLGAHCFDRDNIGVLPKGYMRFLASYVYLKNPGDWQINKRIYLDGNCTWTKI